MMTVTLNGQPREFPREMTLAELLRSLGWEQKPIVVELNGTAILALEYGETQIHDGARIEIITLAAGG